MASSPPTAAIDPDAALDTLEIDVAVPRDTESGRLEKLAEVVWGVEDVKNPARINLVISCPVKSLSETICAVGLLRICSKNLSSDSFNDPFQICILPEG